MLGWIGNVFIVAGLWGVGNRRRHAFIASMVGETIWTANAYWIHHDTALAFICVVFALLAVRSWWLWR